MAGYCTLTVPVMPNETCTAQKYGNVPAVVNVCSYVVPAADSGACAHPASDGEQKRPSALPPVPLTTLCPDVPHVQRTVSPTAIVRLAGENEKPSLPTITVRVRGPCGIVVGVTPAGAVVVVTEAHVPAPQPSQQLGTSPTHIEPPFGGMHAVAFDFTAHVLLPLAVVRQQVTKPGRPHVDCFAHFATSARHDFGRLPRFAAAFAARATHCT